MAAPEMEKRGFELGYVLPDRYTVEQFVTWDLMRSERFELHGSRIVCMSGGSEAHQTAVQRVEKALTVKLLGKPCDVYGGSHAILTPPIADSPYFYPDVSVVCGKPQRVDVHGNSCIANPAVVIEVFSPSTRKYDEGDKLEAYKAIRSMQVVLLVDVEQRKVAVHRRTSEVWTVENPESDVQILAELSLTADEMYSAGPT